MQNVATNGNRTFSVFGVIAEAARLTRGKTLFAIWLPLFVSLLTMSVVFLGGDKVDAYVMSQLPHSSLFTALNYTVMTVAFIGIFYLILGLGCGILKTAIERARGNTVSVTSSFHSFSRVMPFFLTFLCFIPVLAFQLVFLFFVDPKLHPLIWQLIQSVYGLLFTPFFLLALLLVVDKVNSPFKAIGRALHLGTQNWFKIILLLILVDIVSFLIAMPLGIAVAMHNQTILYVGIALVALIYLWLLPFMYLLQGVVYHKLMD